MVEIVMKYYIIWSCDADDSTGVSLDVFGTHGQRPLYLC